MAEISIIVPVYNLEKLLARCVESILSQTFTNFELILVNDGSTDNSGDLCDNYAALDNRVKVIHKENGGVASSRNTGLAAAKGKFIGFVDNDDFIHETMFEQLYNTAIKHSSDIVVCDFAKVKEDQNVNTKDKLKPGPVQHMNNITALHQLYTENGITFVCPWNKIYVKELFDDIKYEDGFINDDETVIHKLLYKSGKMSYINSELYFYVQRSDSQMHSAFNVKRLDMVYALKQRECFFKMKKEKELHQKALKHYLDKFFWYYQLTKSNKNVPKTEFKKLKGTFNSSLLAIFTHCDIGWKQKTMCAVFFLSPALFDLIKNKLERTVKEVKVQ